MVQVCHVSWADGADRYGDDSRFGAAAFAPQIREMVDSLIAASGHANPFPAYVDVIRSATEMESDIELHALAPALDLPNSQNPWDDLCAVWRHGANLGAVAALRIVAERLAQYGTLARWDGEA